MTEKIEPYNVSDSERVRQRLFELGDIAAERGDRAEFLAAVKEFHRRLSIDPQFGEPLSDLRHEPSQNWIGIIPPLHMRYAVLGERRIVFVAALPILLPKSKP